MPGFEAFTGRKDARKTKSAAEAALERESL